ncbi:MAG: head-tail adaptor protein [Lactobacillus sp.]|nr:MAG: head-tail adaptor protein [Lactobacillus sp.]
MDIGGLNVRITIQKNEVVTDKYGNHLIEWKDYFSCWATASGQTGQEEDEAGQTLESDRMNFTVRYCSETAAVVSTEYRIVLGDRIYNILHVDDMAFKKHSRKFLAELVRR